VGNIFLLPTMNCHKMVGNEKMLPTLLLLNPKDAPHQVLGEETGD
jgi:hypothetical protein